MKRIAVLVVCLGLGPACDDKTKEEKQHKALQEQAEAQKKKAAEQAAKLDEQLDDFEKKQQELKGELDAVTKDDEHSEEAEAKADDAPK